MKTAHIFSLLFLPILISAQSNLPPTPQMRSFQPVSTTKSTNNSPSAQAPSQAPFNPILPNDPYAAQNQRIMQQSGMDYPGRPQPTATQKEVEYKKLKTENDEDERRSENNRYIQESLPYKTDYNELTNIDADHFSLAKATYLSENAGYKSKISYQQFQQAIKTNADAIRFSMKAQGLDPKSNTAINYALMQFFGKQFAFKDPKTGKGFALNSFHYDFEDFFGKQDPNKLSVEKLLATRTGQCHSMPLLYLLLCEELGGKAWLVKAPMHSFVRFYDEKGTPYNFETTSGQLIADSYYLQSGYISTASLQNGMYMDTLSKKQMLSSAIVDLVNVYWKNLNYDDFTEKASNKALELDSKNMQAYIIQSNAQTYKCMDMVKQAGMPPLQDIPKYPAIQKEFDKRDALYQQLDNTGRQDIPEKQYAAWLKTIEEIKKREQTAAMQQKLQQQINKLKTKPKVFIIHNKPQ